jgi:hypothetical protein
VGASVVDVPEVERLRDVEAGHHDVDQPVERDGDDAFVAGDCVVAAGAVAPLDGDLVGALVDGGDRRAEPDVGEEERAEGLGETGRRDRSPQRASRPSLGARAGIAGALTRAFSALLTLAAQR